MASLSQEIQRHLKTRFIGKHIYWFETIDSTNKWALDHAADPVQHGDVVIANQQTAGKGRKGRTWYSPPGGNLYLSVFLCPEIAPFQLPQLTLMAGAACCEALMVLTERAIRIKWPNDLYYKDHKLGGILCEAHSREGNITGTVIGIGINAHLDRKTLPAELDRLAISLEEITDRSWERTRVVATLLNHLEAGYLKLTEGEWPAIIKFCNEHNILTNKRVRLSSGDETVRGHVIGLDEAGHLILRLESGAERHFMEGETQLCS